MERDREATREQWCGDRIRIGYLGRRVKRKKVTRGMRYVRRDCRGHDASVCERA